VKHLEAATPDIAQEYLALRDSPGGLPPSDYEASESDHASALHQGQKSWHWASFIDRGVRRPQMTERCPVTRAILDATPRLCVDSMPFAFAFFSTLRGGSRIAPHCAPCNLRVRVHLPLIVPNPDVCGISVAGETRRWEVGKALVFDDAYEHEVWNNGEEDRVVLLFDTWHPDLTDDEVRAIQAMFGEVERMRNDRSKGG
jgi:aspartate beta-hydroxylase